MQRRNLEPTAAHYNLVLRTLKASGYVDKMFKMICGLSMKESPRINGNSYELTVEALLDQNMWKESLAVVKIMSIRSTYQPSLDICVRLVETLERARQYKAVLAMYRLMVHIGYDFYESEILNGIFKKIVSLAAVKANLVTLKIPGINLDDVDATLVKGQKSSSPKEQSVSVSDSLWDEVDFDDFDRQSIASIAMGRESAQQFESEGLPVDISQELFIANSPNNSVRKESSVFRTNYSRNN